MILKNGLKPALCSANGDSHNYRNEGEEKFFHDDRIFRFCKDMNYFSFSRQNMVIVTQNNAVNEVKSHWSDIFCHLSDIRFVLFGVILRCKQESHAFMLCK